MKARRREAKKKQSSAIEEMADLCGIPRRKLAAEIKDRIDDRRHTIWVMKEPKSGLYLFRGPGKSGCFLGNVVSLILGSEFVFTHTRKTIEKVSIVERFKKKYGLKLKPVRITVEIEEGDN